VNQNKSNIAKNCKISKWRKNGIGWHLLVFIKLVVFNKKNGAKLGLADTFGKNAICEWLSAK